MSNPIITTVLVNMVKRHEGFRLKAYKCPAGRWTVGYGHNLDANPLSGETLKRMGYAADVEPEDLLITDSEAEILLREDLVRAWTDLEAVFGDSLLLMGWPRRDALHDMIFWIGRTKFIRFTKMVLAIMAENWALAATELLDSKLARDVPGRAAELAEMLRTDTYAGAD